MWTEVLTGHLDALSRECSIGPPCIDGCLAHEIWEAPKAAKLSLAVLQGPEGEDLFAAAIP